MIGALPGARTPTKKDTHKQAKESRLRSTRTGTRVLSDWKAVRLAVAKLDDKIEGIQQRKHLSQSKYCDKWHQEGVSRGGGIRRVEVVFEECWRNRIGHRRWASLNTNVESLSIMEDKQNVFFVLGKAWKHKRILTPDAIWINFRSRLPRLDKGISKLECLLINFSNQVVVSFPSYCVFFSRPRLNKRKNMSQFKKPFFVAMTTLKTLETWKWLKWLPFRTSRTEEKIINLFQTSNPVRLSRKKGWETQGLDRVFHFL